MSIMSIMNPATMLPERWQDFQDQTIMLAGRKVDLQVPPPAVEVAEDVNVEPEVDIASSLSHHAGRQES